MKDKTKNILSHLGKIPVFLAGHFLFSFFLVIFFVIFLANLLFYKYYILNQEITPKAEQGQVVINEKSHNDLLKIWEEQDEKFQNSDSKNYSDLFKVR
ncbi:hypothetical protein KKE19_01185 [Patescibacteria group bacterium]|nr:hypothetical protein [Patescibacteria group bacterium]MBU4368014.1 hypothetical protein [Patescibacteria group bacterium]MBU4462249.1 hypothetical protein [Patescibacteria group bacterium]MCG2699605.1 hypothetical protein [Candidatus Parcubacteria bacterium]